MNRRDWQAAATSDSQASCTLNFEQNWQRLLLNFGLIDPVEEHGSDHNRLVAVFHGSWDAGLFLPAAQHPLTFARRASAAAWTRARARSRESSSASTAQFAPELSPAPEGAGMAGALNGERAKCRDEGHTSRLFYRVAPTAVSARTPSANIIWCTTGFESKRGPAAASRTIARCRGRKSCASVASKRASAAGSRAATSPTYRSTIQAKLLCPRACANASREGRVAGDTALTLAAGGTSRGHSCCP